MGVGGKPQDPPPVPDPCEGSVWMPEGQYNRVVVEFKDVWLDPAYPEKSVYVPDGLYDCNWVECDRWECVTGPIVDPDGGVMTEMVVRLVYYSSYYAIMSVRRYASTAQFLSESDVLAGDWIDNYLQQGWMTISGGSARLRLDLTVDRQSAIWEAGRLIGVPETDDYKAEEFEGTNFSKSFRYACHRDRTNVRIYRDY